MEKYEFQLLNDNEDMEYEEENNLGFRFFCVCVYDFKNPIAQSSLFLYAYIYQYNGSLGWD